MNMEGWGHGRMVQAGGTGYNSLLVVLAAGARMMRAYPLERRCDDVSFGRRLGPYLGVCRCQWNMCGVTLWNMYVGRQQCIVCVPCSRVRAYIPSPVRAVERRTERERVAAVHRPYTITHISTNVDRICRNVVVEIIITEIVNLLKYPHPLVRH